VLNHCLEWDKWVLTNFDHDRQWFNTLIPLSHEAAAVSGVLTLDCISGLSGPVKLILRYTTPDIRCRKDRWYEWDGGIRLRSHWHSTQWRREARARQVKWTWLKGFRPGCYFFLLKYMCIEGEHTRNDAVSLCLPTAKMWNKSQVSINVIFFHYCLGNKDCN